MRFDIFSLFPAYFQGPFDVSILRRAKEKELIDIRLFDIRDFSKDKQRRVDDRPFGGGPGMVLMAQPVVDAIRSTKSESTHVVYLSPQGRRFTNRVAEELSKKEHLILLCGHYEGIDQRAVDAVVDEEISIGDYVLTNGCVAAIILVDAIARFIPGVLGKEESAQLDTFHLPLFEAPVYTRPEEFEGRVVPEILRGGNHKKIQKWKEKEALDKTMRVRPDLLK